MISYTKTSKPNMVKRLFFLIIVIFALKGCTRDDICPEGEATTPNLIITFNDSNIPAKRKKVTRLTLETDYEDSKILFALSETDSIAIPLDVNSDLTKYRFILTKGTAENPDINVDKIRFDYSRRDIYVNRACGFSTEFTDLDYTLEDEGNENWIKEIIIKRDSIVDENQAHLIILH